MSGAPRDSTSATSRNTRVAKSAALVAAGAAAAVAGCGDGDTRSRAGVAPTGPDHHIASTTLGRGQDARLFAVPGLGRFRASCTSPGVARISYRAAPGSATQSVTTRTARGESPTAWVDPGDRASAAIDRDRAPRADWQVALLSKGRQQVLRASFTVARLPKFGCFVTGIADGARR
jgi:hypothetical protein